MRSAAANRSSTSFDTKSATETLRQMLRIRRFEEKCVELYSLGKIRGFLHLYIGEEAVAIGTIPLLKSEDRIVSTYREHGHALARGISAGAVMAEMFGKANGCCRGRGGSMHIFDKTTNFYGGNAIVGGGLPLAVGLALADRLLDRSAVTACFFGDGAVAEGEFHESMNLAALWQLPVLFICENNLYAMGTAVERHQAVTDIATKAEGYGIRSETVDGMNVVAVRDAAERAIDFVRRQCAPFLLVARTYRFRAHSMYDPELYRQKKEVKAWEERCPIASFEKIVREENLIADETIAEIEASVSDEITRAIDFAETGGVEPVENLTTDVYTTVWD
jgi:pyruvate dehydrogenase E1 component alpha subunit